MVKFRIDRKFLYKKDNDLNAFLTIIGTNISTKALFTTIAAKGTVLLARNEEFKEAYKAVLEGDKRKLSTRNNLRITLDKLAREIANDVSKLAEGDEVIINAAGFEAIYTSNSKGSMGGTILISVKYYPLTNKVKLRCRKVDLALDYQIDVSMDNITWEEGVDSMPLTLYTIKWKRGKGKFFIRVCPRDKKGDRGTHSNILPISIY